MRMVLVNQNYRFLAIWLPYPLTKEDLVTIGNQLFCIFIHRSFTHIFKIGILNPMQNYASRLCTHIIIQFLFWMQFKLVFGYKSPECIFFLNMLLRGKGFNPL